MVEALVKEVVAVLKRFVWFKREEEYLALALWVLHTWVFEAANATPYIWIYAPLPKCGKTRTLETVRLLVRNPRMFNDPTPSVLFRMLDQGFATMLLDEVDRIFKFRGDDAGVQSSLRSILNSGYRPGDPVYRSAPHGRDWVPEEHKVFCPKALDGLRDALPDTLRSRCIPIPMHRRPKDVELERLIQYKVEREVEPLRERLQSWAETTLPALQGVEPELPGELDDRQQEIWEPMFAIADLDGGGLGLLARRAAMTLHYEEPEEEPAEIMLLRHIRDAFDQEQAPRLSTVQIVKFLLTRGDDSPWHVALGVSWDTFNRLPEEERKGRMRSIGMTISRLLKPYKIKADRLQIGPKVQAGYERAWFEEAWRSYL